MKGSRQNFQKEFLILIAILVGAGLLRFYSLGHPFYHTDEAAQLLSSLRLYQTTPFQFSPLASNFFAQIFSYQYGFASVTLPFFFYWILSTLGIPLREWVLILPSTLAGMAAIVMVYVLGRRLFSPGAGLLAAALLAVLPEAVAHSRTVRWMSYTTVVQGLTVLAFVRYFERPTRGRAYLASAAIALEMGTNNTFPFTLLAVGVLGLITLGPQGGSTFWARLRELLRSLLRPAVWIFPVVVLGIYSLQYTLSYRTGFPVGFLQRILEKPDGIGSYGEIFWPAAFLAFTPLVCLALGGALLFVLFRFRARPHLLFPAVWLTTMAGASLLFVPLGRFKMLLMMVPAVLLLGAVFSDVASLSGRVFSSARTAGRLAVGGLVGLLVLSPLSYTLAENFRLDPLRLGLRPGVGAVGVGDRNRAMKTVGYYLRKLTPPESTVFTPGKVYERTMPSELYFGKRVLKGSEGEPTLFLTIPEARGQRVDYVVIFEDGPFLSENDRGLNEGARRQAREWGMRLVARVRDGEDVLAVIYGKEGEVQDLDVKIYDPLFDREFTNIRRWAPDFYLGGFKMARSPLLGFSEERGEV